MSKKTLGRAAGVLVTLFVTGVFLVFAGRLVTERLARDKRIEEMAEQAGITVEFNVPASPTTYREISELTADLAVWEQEQQKMINETFGITNSEFAVWTKDPDDRSLERIGPEVVAIREKGFKLRKELDENFLKAVGQIFAQQDRIPDLLLEKNDVLYCYQIRNLDKVVRTKTQIDKKDAYRLFKTATEMEEDDSDDVAMYMAYGIAPEMMIEGCEKALEKALATEDYWKVHSAVFDAEWFERKCNVEIASLKDVKKEETRLERAYKKKLYSSSSNKSSSSKKSSSSGKSSYSSGRSYGYSYYSSDHDIEAYYEDNRDEYDDYDDAYEGFLDDEGMWDDY